METVEVLVKIFDRGQTREEVVPVETECFRPGHLCWKSIAALKAAVVMEIPFVQVERSAKFGLRPEDRERLRALYGGKGDADPSAPASPLLRMTEGGTGNAERV